MFERFTEMAREVVILAEEEARELKHGYIGTEHILLAILRQETGPGARALRSLGISVERSRDLLLQITPQGEEVTASRLPFTPRSKKVLELALREALSLRHNYIGTEHILLGLVRENEGLAIRILTDSGAPSETVRNEVIRMLSGPDPRQADVGQPRPAASGGLPETLFDGAYPMLDRVAAEIGERLSRPPDAGDLLLVLASVPNGLVASALERLGIDMDELMGVVDGARSDGARSRLLPPLELSAQFEEVRRQKEDKIEAQEWEMAAELRDQERELTRQAWEVNQSLDEVLDLVRRRLGLAGN